MSNVIILHGRPGLDEYYDPSVPEPSHAHWLGWLHRQCIINDLNSLSLDIPHAYEPHYETWAHEFEKQTIDDETILVGHSTGAGFFIRWLSGHKNVFIKKLILVAPYLDPLKELTSEKSKDFFNFVRDPELLNRIEETKIFHSDNDMEDIQLSVQEIRNVWAEVKYREFLNYGHFCLGDMGTTEFPELLEEVLA